MKIHRFNKNPFRLASSEHQEALQWFLMRPPGAITFMYNETDSNGEIYNDNNEYWSSEPYVAKFYPSYIKFRYDDDYVVYMLTYGDLRNE